VSPTERMSPPASDNRPARRFRAAEPPAACPPADVLEAIAAADEAYERLEASGRHLHFDIDQITGKLTVRLLDLEGRLLRVVPPATVLDVATGGSLD
jgi:hypothetical protein